MPRYFTIDEFHGIIQGQYGSLLNPGTAADARNMDTSDGSLAVAKGFTRHIQQPVPGADRLLKLMIAKGAANPYYAVTAGHIYHFNGSAWASIYQFPTALDRDVSFIQTKIGEEDYLLVATGRHQLVKIKLRTAEASLFGSGETALSTTVAAYADKVITVATITQELITRATVFGVTVKGDTMAVEKGDAAAKTLTLAETPKTAPAKNDALTIPGGGSTAKVNYLAVYYGRLFSAGDPDNPARLYWSTVAGDGRSIEDWLAVVGSPDASGGFAEIGDTAGDPIIGLCAISNQLLIFKRYTVYRLYGDRPGNYTIECVEATGGSISNASITVKYDVPYYLAAQGIMYFNNVSVVPLDNGARYIDGIMDKADIQHAKGVNKRNVLYFSCKLNPASEYDDAMILYNATRGTFMVRDGFEVADMCVVDDVFYLLTDKRYVCIFGQGKDYDGEPIHAYWETQETELGEKFRRKQLNEVYMLCVGEALILNVYAGGCAREIRRKVVWDGSGENLVELPLSIDRSRTFKLRLANEEGSYFKIKGGLQIKFESEIRP